MLLNGIVSNDSLFWGGGAVPFSPRNLDEIESFFVYLLGLVYDALFISFPNA